MNDLGTRLAAYSIPYDEEYIAHADQKAKTELGLALIESMELGKTYSIRVSKRTETRVKSGGEFFDTLGNQLIAWEARVIPLREADELERVIQNQARRISALEAVIEEMQEAGY